MPAIVQPVYRLLDLSNSGGVAAVRGARENALLPFLQLNHRVPDRALLVARAFFTRHHCHSLALCGFADPSAMGFQNGRGFLGEDDQLALLKALNGARA